MADPIYDDDKDRLEEAGRVQRESTDKAYKHYLDKHVDEDNPDNLGNFEEAFDDDEELQDFKDTHDKAEADEEAELNERLGSSLRDSYAADEDYFNSEEGKKRAGLLSKSFMKKRAAVLATTGLFGILLSFGGFLGFLQTFRLKHLLENINFQAFSRYNAAFDRRSDKWMKAYFKVRLMEWNGDLAPDGDGNVYFRANRVDTDNPFKDWYRTMRTSKFEADLLQKQGIRFTSVIGPDQRPRLGRIEIKNRGFDVDLGNGNFTNIDDLINSPGKLDNALGRIDNKVVEVFDTDRSARRAIKNAVNDNTRKWQVLKRRHTRKAIANMTGVRDWRFFDKTRTKYEDKKTEFKKKMIQKVFPTDSRSGSFLMCILGLGGCVATTDPNNPDNKRGAGSAAGVQQANADSEGVDENGQPLPEEPTDGNGYNDAGRIAREGAEEIAEEALEEGAELTEKKFTRELMERMTRAFTTALSGGPPGFSQVKAILEWALKFDNNLAVNGTTGRSKIGDAVYMARMAGSLMLAYSTISTIADQMQSGEVDPDQLNAAMNYFNGIEKSEGFNFIFEGTDFGDNPMQTRGVASSTGSSILDIFGGTAYAQGSGDPTERIDKCESGEDLVPFCDIYKPNGGTRIDGLQDAWNRYVTNSPLGAVIDAYRSAKESVVGRFVSFIGNAIGDAVGVVLNPILDALGISDLIGGAASWLAERVLSWIGVKPCMTGAEDIGGMVPNCLVGGAAASAESLTRTTGGALSKLGNDTGYQYAEKLAIDYIQEQYDSMSTFDRYFAFDNPLSLGSNLLFSFSLNPSFGGVLGNLLSFNSNLGKGLGGFGSIFSGKAMAASENYRNTSAFSGVDQYFIPKECVDDLDPLGDNYYQNATNNDDITKDAATLGNGDAFSTALYTENGDSLDGNEIEKIYSTYNCAAFDNAVLGGLGGLYGYDKDDGYSSSAAGGTPSGVVGNFTAGTMPEVSGHQSDPCPAGLADRGVQNSAAAGPVKLCDVHGYSINVIMAASFNSLYNDMQAAGFSVPGGAGNFRSYETQAEMHRRSPSSTAPPGRSNHELGLAVDTECSGGGAAFSPWMPSKSRGLEDFQRAINEHPCLNWIHTNSSRYGLLLQCDGRGSNGGEIAARSGGCETWHLSPTGK